MPLIRPRRSRLQLTCMAIVSWAVISVSLASACTIPVFRYALERWESDRFLVIVYHDGKLTDEQKAVIKDLEQRSSGAGGPLNIEVVRFDLTSPSPPKLLPDVEPPVDRPLPWVEVRARVRGMRTALRWEGSLMEAIDLPGLFDSPARSEVVRRILDGHSSVWLLIAPEEESQRLSEQLQAALDGVTRDLALPQGVGLPGSELYASIPLEIRYSVLPISHTDPNEKQFLKWLAAFNADWRTDTAYIVPVFGRCRALEVIPYAEADALLIEDVANFLCGACSCRVKQANPGFDLLASVNWDQRLFGESSLRPTAISAPPPSAGYLEIPSGNRTAVMTEPTLPPESEKSEADRAVEENVLASRAEAGATTLGHVPSSIKTWLVLVVLALVGGGTLSGAILARRWLTRS